MLSSTATRRRMSGGSRDYSYLRSTSPVSLDAFGGSSMALVIISIPGGLFLVSRCFRQDICFMGLQSDRPNNSLGCEMRSIP